MLCAIVLAAVPGPSMGQGETGADAAALYELSLADAVRLALTKSRAAAEARLGREEQQLSLEAAEERYDPTAHLRLGGNIRSRSEETADLSVGSMLRVSTGGEFRLSFHKPLAGAIDRDPTMTLTFSQPLLKGFGPEFDIQPLRRARLLERIGLRTFRDRAAGIVDEAVSAYRGVLRAQRRLAIARDALERARRQIGINRALVEVGRMASQDLVQTEADVVNKEYTLADAENALETAVSGFVNTLDLEDGARIEVQAEPPVEPERPDFRESLKTAFARRTDWLSAEIGTQLARMELRSAENALLPDLSLSVGIERKFGNRRTDWSAGLNLTVQLQDDGPRRLLAGARIGLRRAKLALAERRQSIRIEVQRAVRDVAIALRQIGLARQARELAERKLDVERRKLQQGLSSAFLLSRFEDDLVSAQGRELDADARYRDTVARLDRIQGTTLDRWGIAVERVGR